MKHFIIIAAILLIPGLPPAAHAADIPGELIARNPIQPDLGFAASVDDVLALYRQEKPLLLVDVRGRADFERVNIPGSIHVPLHFLKTKGWLRKHPFILVNEGRDYHRLQKECTSLKKEGFTPSILHGGLNLWRRKGGPLGGDPLAQTGLDLITARDFYREKEIEDVLAIDISETRSPESLRLAPYAIHAPFSPDDEKAAEAFLVLVDKHGKKPTPTILVLDEDGRGSERARRLLAREELNLFFLEGGVQSYKRFLMDLTASHQPRESRMRNLDKCKTCKKDEPPQSSID